MCLSTIADLTLIVERTGDTRETTPFFYAISSGPVSINYNKQFSPFGHPLNLYKFHLYIKSIVYF